MGVFSFICLASIKHRPRKPTQVFTSPITLGIAYLNLFRRQTSYNLYFMGKELTHRKLRASVGAMYLDSLKLPHKLFDKIVKAAYSRVGKQVSEGQSCYLVAWL